MMNLNNIINKIYNIIDEKRIDYYDAECLYLEHIKTGAKIVIIKNKDKHKICTIGFKTIPVSSNGVAHVTEHCVTRGSLKYPQKEPRKELEMIYNNLYIDGMTYPDKTLFVISALEKEALHKSIDVIIDGIFNPAMYEHEEIFMQEGWYIDTDGKNNFLTGIVLNEMLQYYTNAYRVSYITAMKNLFPNSFYQYDAAGEPYEIPTLTYEQMLVFHKSNYHPSNSYIYLYGDISVIEELEQLDLFLSRFDKIEINNNVIDCLNKPLLIDYENSIHKNKKLIISFNYILDLSNPEEYYAIDIVMIYILGYNKANLNSILKENNVNVTISYEIIKSIQHPTLQVRFSGADINSIEIIKKSMNEFLSQIINKDIDLQIWNGILNRYEYAFNENNSLKDSLGFKIQNKLFDSWLYNRDPFIYLDIGNILNNIRGVFGNDYLKNIVENYMLKNKLQNITIVEDKKYKYEIDSAFNNSRFNNNLKIMNDNKRLEKYMNRREDIIEKINIEDISNDYSLESYCTNNISGIDYICYADESLGNLSKISFKFNLCDLYDEKVYLLGLLKDMLFLMDNDTFSRYEIDEFIFQNTYKFKTDVNVYVNVRNNTDYSSYLEINLKVLNDNIEKVIEFIFTVISATFICNEDILKENIPIIINNYKRKIRSNSIDMSIINNMANISDYGKVLDFSRGFGYIEYLENIRINGIISELESLKKIIFCKNNALFTIISNRNAENIFKEKSTIYASRLFSELPRNDKKWSKVERAVDRVILYEKSKNCFVRQGNFINLGYSYNGIMLLLEEIMEKDFLWKKIRLHNGAYNTQTKFLRSGELYFSSYMDLNIERTDAIIKSIPYYLETLKLTEMEFEKYKASAIKKMNARVSVENKGDWIINLVLKKADKQLLEDEYWQVRNTKAIDIKEYSSIIQDILSNSISCAVVSR